MDLPTNLDLPGHERLLKRGVGFNQFHANTTPCSPSRSVIYTGQHTMHTGMVTNLGAPPFPELSRELATVGHQFRELGYYTTYKGKWHLSNIEPGDDLVYGTYPARCDDLEPYGFSDYNLTGDPHGTVWQGYQADRMVTAEACRWLDKTAPTLDQPWMLAVNFVNPHDIMFFSTGEAQDASRLNRNFIAPLRPAPDDPLYEKDWSEAGLPASFRADDLGSKPWVHRRYAQLIDQLYGHIDPDDEAAWLANQSYYFNCIRDVSRQVDRVLQVLERSGQLDNTIIVYTADHGEMAGAHGLRQKGPTVYKENSRIPLVVSHPDIAGGQHVDNLGCTLDVLPTMLSLATDGQAQPDLPGVDLSPALSGNRTRRDDDGVLFAYGVTLYMDPEAVAKAAASGTMITPERLAALHERGVPGPRMDNRAFHRGLFDGRYKFARYFQPDSHHLPADWGTLVAHNDLELYDTQVDPNELDNLAAQPEQARALLLELNARTNDLIRREIGADQGDELPGPPASHALQTATA